MARILKLNVENLDARLMQRQLWAMKTLRGSWWRGGPDFSIKATGDGHLYTSLVEMDTRKLLLVCWTVELISQQPAKLDGHHCTQQLTEAMLKLLSCY